MLNIYYHITNYFSENTVEDNILIAKKKVLNNLKSLELVDQYIAFCLNCKIEIQCNAFQQMTSLEKLYIGYMDGSLIFNKDTFKGLDKLKSLELKLDNENINFESDLFGHLSSLESLDIEVYFVNVHYLFVFVVFGR